MWSLVYGYSECHTILKGYSGKMGTLGRIIPEKLGSRYALTRGSAPRYWTSVRGELGATLRLAEALYEAMPVGGMGLDRPCESRRSWWKV
jgi:hypothetical protein